MGFFPGSTIGNLTPEEAVQFLRGCRELLGPGGGMIVGADLKKDEAVLHAAYNDAAGVTARFTLNLLERMNRELDADFDLSRFAHEAFYNPVLGRIEIYIRSQMDQIVRVAGRRFMFADAELVELARDRLLVGHAEIDALGLRPVAQGRVVKIDALARHDSASYGDGGDKSRICKELSRAFDPGLDCFAYGSQ